MVNVPQILSALAEPIRLQSMQFLADGKEYCVCELMEHLSASQSRMSRHLGILKAAGLLIDRRDAQWVRYRLNPAMPKDVKNLVNAVITAANKSQSLAA